MIHQLNLITGLDKVETVLKRLKTFEPADGYYLAFSGGKDSVVIKALADMAGVKYDAHYNVTSVDPPELVRFIKQNHPDVAFDYPRDKNGKVITMWNLIPRKNMPPTPHGRLIDADKLIDDAHIHWSATTNESCFLCDDIDDAPTVIDEEE